MEATGYECSSTAGNAACSYNNVVYPDSGNPYTVAYGESHCNATSGSLPALSTAFIHPGGGGYNASRSTTGSIAASVSPRASFSPIEAFAGGASTGRSLSVLAVAISWAIMAVMLI